MFLGGRGLKQTKKPGKSDIFSIVTLTPFTACQMNSTHESNSPVIVPIDSCFTQNPTERQIHVNDQSILFVRKKWLQMLSPA